MKKINLKKVVLFTLLAGLLYSCEQTELIETETIDDITSEIEKIETIYQKGDIKIENDTSKEKVETIASSDLMKEIHGNLEKSYSKTTTYSKSSALYIGGYGVFMGNGGTCGSYKILDVYMDCEDSRPKTFKTNYTGASIIVGNNVLLRFCVVGGGSFSGNTFNEDFGVLNLGYNRLVYKGSSVTRHFDNEDSRNTNYVRLNGSNISGALGDTNLGGGHTILGERNTRLTFHIFYKNRYGVGSDFPNLGFSYGLLGSFGSGSANRGSINLDDEDRRNANYCFFSEYDHVSGISNYAASGKYISSSIPGFMDVGENTKLFFSKAR
jgi:hypothetical protein|tara:strand:- start:1142 stop:2113 length:972 start_codon:yes stop_codon:yes gene_type:complete